jgi:uncharacterized protein (DUF111 family)
MSLLIIDPVSGMAGDMFCAALFDAGAEKKRMLAVMQQTAEHIGGAKMSCHDESRFDIQGTRLYCKYAGQVPHADSDFLSEILQRSCSEHNIRGAYKEYTQRAFSILKQAEQDAHKKISENSNQQPGHGHSVHLHEAQDIIVDIIGSAWALQHLNVQLQKVCCAAPVATGGGKISFSHGTFPVPAPATQEIINRYAFPTSSGPVDRELLTPTGAALLAALEPTFIDRAEHSFDFPQSVGRGVGFGSTYNKGKDKTSVNALFLFLITLRNG